MQIKDVNDNAPRWKPFVRGNFEKLVEVVQNIYEEEMADSNDLGKSKIDESNPLKNVDNFSSNAVQMGRVTSLKDNSKIDNKNNNLIKQIDKNELQLLVYSNFITFNSRLGSFSAVDRDLNNSLTYSFYITHVVENKAAENNMDYEKIRTNLYDSEDQTTLIQLNDSLERFGKNKNKTNNSQQIKTRNNKKQSNIQINYLNEEITKENIYAFEKNPEKISRESNFIKHIFTIDPIEGDFKFSSAKKIRKLFNFDRVLSKNQLRRHLVNFLFAIHSLVLAVSVEDGDTHTNTITTTIIFNHTKRHIDLQDLQQYMYLEYWEEETTESESMILSLLSRHLVKIVLSMVLLVVALLLVLVYSLLCFLKKKKKKKKKSKKKKKKIVLNSQQQDINSQNNAFNNSDDHLFNMKLGVGKIWKGYVKYDQKVLINKKEKGLNRKQQPLQLDVQNANQIQNDFVEIFNLDSKKNSQKKINKMLKNKAKCKTRIDQNEIIFKGASIECHKNKTAVFEALNDFNLSPHNNNDITTPKKLSINNFNNEIIMPTESFKEHTTETNSTSIISPKNLSSISSKTIPTLAIQSSFSNLTLSKEINPKISKHIPTEIQSELFSYEVETEKHKTPIKPRENMLTTFASKDFKKEPLKRNNENKNENTFTSPPFQSLNANKLDVSNHNKSDENNNAENFESCEKKKINIFIENKNNKGENAYHDKNNSLRSIEYKFRSPPIGITSINSQKPINKTKETLHKTNESDSIDVRSKTSPNLAHSTSVKTLPLLKKKPLEFSKTQSKPFTITKSFHTPKKISLEVAKGSAKPPKESCSTRITTFSSDISTLYS